MAQGLGEGEGSRPSHETGQSVEDCRGLSRGKIFDTGL
jgi:hypothetical protein